MSVPEDPSELPSSRDARHVRLTWSNQVDVALKYPMPLVPRVTHTEGAVNEVRFFWVNGSDVTDSYSIERLHYALNDKALMRSGTAAEPSTVRPSPFAANAARPPAPVADNRIWVEWLNVPPVVARACKGAELCASDKTLKVIATAGPAVEPMQYRVCAANRAGRACSEPVSPNFSVQRIVPTPPAPSVVKVQPPPPSNAHLACIIGKDPSDPTRQCAVSEKALGATCKCPRIYGEGRVGWSTYIPQEKRRALGFGR
ncbi:MAG TPA: hypothetical protein VI319_12420 [Burkholderiales bacterium]